MPAQILLGNTVSNGPSKAVFNRSCGSGYGMACEEAQFQTDFGNSTFRWGADRRHYLFFEDRSWPDNADTSHGRISGHAEADHERNRLSITSHKSSAFSWAQVGACSSTVNVQIYDDINFTAAQIAAWQATYAGVGKWGSTFVWTFEHEPNQASKVSSNGGSLAVAAANWRAAVQNIYNLFLTNGVTIWAGNEDFGTTQEGMILALDMVSGHTTQGHDIETWWGPSTATADTTPGDTWMDAHVLMHAGDHYNRGPLFQRWEYTSSFFKDWSDAKHTYQNAQGRKFITAIWETGVQLANQYTGTHSSWDATGLAATPENWLTDLLAYNKTWTNLDLFCYWDSTGTFSYELDSSLSYWQTAGAVFSDPLWAIAGTALPSTSAPTDTWELGMVW